MAERPIDGTPENYGWMCQELAREKYDVNRRFATELQLAVNHPHFESAHRRVIDELSREKIETLSLVSRPPSFAARVGLIRTMYEWAEIVTQINYQISDYAVNLIVHPEFAGSIVRAEEDIDFIIASNVDLGYPLGCTREQSYKAGIEDFGFDLCEASDVMDIRFSYLNQPKGEWLLLAMEPITSAEDEQNIALDEHNIFLLSCDEQALWLGAGFGHPDHFYDGKTKWIFRYR